jgi:hypothetical protein
MTASQVQHDEIDNRMTFHIEGDAQGLDVRADHTPPGGSRSGGQPKAITAAPCPPAAE